MPYMHLSPHRCSRRSACSTHVRKRRGEMVERSRRSRPTRRKTLVLSTRKVASPQRFELYRASSSQPRDDARQSRLREGIQAGGPSKTTRDTSTARIWICPGWGRDRGENRPPRIPTKIVVERYTSPFAGRSECIRAVPSILRSSALVPPPFDRTLVGSRSDGLRGWGPRSSRERPARWSAYHPPAARRDSPPPAPRRVAPARVGAHPATHSTVRAHFEKSNRGSLARDHFVASPGRGKEGRSEVDHAGTFGPTPLRTSCATPGRGDGRG
jgi:hypothetical protein